MSKDSERPNGAQIKEKRKEYNQNRKELRETQKESDLNPSSHSTTSNHKCKYSSAEEERNERNEAILETVKIFRAHLPVLLKRLSKIDDPRSPKKIKHKLTVLLVYGILSFIFQMSSRREANREMTRPMFWQNLTFFFPELETLPHHDTITRLLSGIEVNEIESIHLDLMRTMIRKKKFRRYLIDNCFPIAIDGTGKFKRNWLWQEECLERKNKNDEGIQYYVYVLEANLTFHNGMTIPLMSEFLSYTEGDDVRKKQDCELNAFYRLAERLKDAFPALKIMLLLDGLYAKGPVIALCRKYKWQYMIVLKDDSLPSVMGEFKALSSIDQESRSAGTWRSRKQRFKWVNGIEYCFGSNGKRRLCLHVIECTEYWQEPDIKTGRIIEKNSRHVWLSSEPLNRSILHERCNLAARSRWGIEIGILVEKHHGYQYEHCFSYNWNAMKGYHYLMRLAHMFNVIARFSEKLAKFIKDTGIRGFIRFLRDTMTGPWLDCEWLTECLQAPFQLRLQ